MKAKGFIQAGIAVLLAVLIGIVAYGPELLLAVLLIAGMAFSIRWLFVSALSTWGFVDLTIKAFVVCFAILVLGRPIFTIFESIALDDSVDAYAGTPVVVALGLALAVYLFGIFRRIQSLTKRWRQPSVARPVYSDES